MNIPTPIIEIPSLLFQPGYITITCGARDQVNARYINDEPKDIFMDFLARHLGGDWAQMGASAAEANRRAAIVGTRILSEFRLQLTADLGPQKLWIITEADRSKTTILLPDEY